jgi:hypothetical protein
MNAGPSHAALVEEVGRAIAKAFGRQSPIWRDDAAAEAALAILAARLSDVTPEMVEAWLKTDGDDDRLSATEAATMDWRAMLAASPLAAGEDTP